MVIEYESVRENILILKKNREYWLKLVIFNILKGLLRLKNIFLNILYFLGICYMLKNKI